MRPILLALIVTLIIPGLSLVHADMVLDWNNGAIEAISIDKSPPPKASRALAISQAAVYDSVICTYQTNTPYKFQFSVYLGAWANAAVAHNGYTALSALFPI